MNKTLKQQLIARMKGYEAVEKYKFKEIRNTPLPVKVRQVLQLLSASNFFKFKKRPLSLYKNSNWTKLRKMLSVSSHA